MTGSAEQARPAQDPVTEISERLAHLPQRYRDPKLVFHVVARLQPVTTDELDAKLELPRGRIDRLARDHPGILDETGGHAVPTWVLAPGVCRECLCVDSDACVDEETGETCDWANRERNLCTFCAEDNEDGDPRQGDDEDVVDELVTGQDPALERDIPRHDDDPAPPKVPPDPADVSDQLDAERRAAEQLAGEDDVDQELEDDAGEDLDEDEDLTERQRDILEALEDLGPNGESVSTSVLYPALAETWGIPLDSARKAASGLLSTTLKESGHVEDRGYAKWALPGLDPPDPDEVVGPPPGVGSFKPVFYEDIYQVVLGDVYSRTEDIAKELRLNNRQVGARCTRDPRLAKGKRNHWRIRRVQDVDDPWDVSDWPGDGDLLEHEWPCPHKGVVTPEGTQSCEFATRSVAEIQEHQETCPLDPDRVRQELLDDVDEDLVQDDAGDVDQVLEEHDASSERREADELAAVVEQLLEERARVAALEDQVARLEERLEAASRGQAVAEDMVVVHDQLEQELQEAKAREQELELDLADAWGRVDHLEELLKARARAEAPIGAHPLVIAFLAFALIVAAWVLGLWMGGAA